MSLWRDVFWIACLLVIMGIISGNGLRYSTHWNAVEIGPIPPASSTASLETEPDAIEPDPPSDDPQEPVTLAQIKR